MPILNHLLKEIKPQRDAKQVLTICRSLNRRKYCPRLLQSWLMDQQSSRVLSGRTILAFNHWKMLIRNHLLQLISNCNLKRTNALTSSSWHSINLKVSERSLMVFLVYPLIRTQASKNFITSGHLRIMVLLTTLWSVSRSHLKIWVRHHMLSSEVITLHRLLEELVDSRLSRIMRIG